MSPVNWFAVGMCAAFGGQWLGMLLIAGQRRRFRAAVPLAFTEGHIQRGNGNGGPSTGKPVIKPPPGLRPRFIADEERLREVADAINRYRKAGQEFPVEWLDEYEELCRKWKPLARSMRQRSELAIGR